MKVTHYTAVCSIHTHVRDLTAAEHRNHNGHVDDLDLSFPHTMGSAQCSN
jgi:hypothetical protein